MYCTITAILTALVHIGCYGHNNAYIYRTKNSYVFEHVGLCIKSLAVEVVLSRTQIYVTSFCMYFSGEAL